eukprot:TCONS_00049217-protein
MKIIACLAVVLCIIQCTYADGTTASPQKKTCSDLLDQATCDSLQKLVDRLKEAKSTIQDAIDAAVKAHVQTKEEIKKYVKNFIAQRIQCEKILSGDMCTVLDAVAKQLKLTKQQVQQAIETAVSAGKEGAKQVYQEVLKVLQGDIDCDRILGAEACKNLGSALDKFHEQRQLIKEAILDVAMKHYNNTKNLLGLVQEELAKRITNFQCSSVMPADLCTKIMEIATHLKISTDKVREAIELAVMNGLSTANAIYKFTLDFLTDLISCDKILSPTACANFVEATKKFKEQTKLIKQAIMDAVEQKITNAKEITKYVANKIIEMAVNFECTDVMPQKQCDLLFKIAGRFHIRTKELIRVLKQAIVDGKSTVKAIYDVTIKALVNEAKNLTCEEMIDPTVCAVLDNFASKLKETKDDVTNAVRTAIAQGMTTIQDIRAYVRNLLVDEKSCYDFFRSHLVCKSIQLGAWIKGVTFDRVINKIKELYANGVTTIKGIRQKLREIFGISTPDRRRKSAIGILATKDEIVDLAMQIVGGIMKFSQKATENIRADIRKLVESGKMRLTNMYSKVKELIQKYNPLSDEFEDEVPSDMKSLSETYKAARKALALAIQRIILIAKRAGMKSEALMKMIKDLLYKEGVKDLNNAMLSAF